jgi:DNA-binding response OmpR family regulator
MDSPILVIEINKALALKIAGALEDAGYEAVTTGDMFTGLRLLYESNPRLVILVRNAPPNEDDDSFLTFRKAAEAPVLVVGPREDCVDMLECGADAYMNTPASLIELVARVNALLRQRNERCTSTHHATRIAG